MKYAIDQTVTFKPLNQVATVVNVTPYHDAGDPHAVVTIRLRSGDLRAVPARIQDDYLTTEKPLPWLKKWPLPKQ